MIVSLNDQPKASPPRKRPRRGGFQKKRPLPWWARLLLLLFGWLLVLIGIAGLILPGIQGVLTIFAGAAVLSLVSELAYDLLRWSFRRWPRGWRRVVKLRNRVHGWFHPREGQPSAAVRDAPTSPPRDSGPQDETQSSSNDG